jgi:hypothetical protein
VAINPFQNLDENVALSANERFSFDIDSEIAIVGCTLERRKMGLFSVPTSEDLKLIKTQVAAICHWCHFENLPIQLHNAILAASCAG